MTQQAAIIQSLKKGWKSPLDALKEAGTMKLSTRVGELRKLGFVVASKWHDSKKYKLYKITQSPKR
jgi:hypothetical protein